MRALKEYIEDLTKVQPEDFLKRHRWPVLLMRRSNTDDDGGGFQTMLVSRVKMGQVQLALEGQASVYPLQKRQGGAFSEQISVGRTRSVDISLSYPEVSKFHAFFRVDAATNGWTLADAGATNGTFINARRLVSQEVVPVSNGNALRFGLCEFTFLSPEGFLDYVAARFRMTMGQDSPIHRISGVSKQHM